MRKAPWTDFKGDDIREGDVMSHPSGQQGTVVFHHERKAPSDQWVIDYGEIGLESRLCLQVGDRGQAIVI